MNYKNSVLQIIMEIYYTLQQQQIICIIFKADLGIHFLKRFLFFQIKICEPLFGKNKLI